MKELFTPNHLMWLETVEKSEHWDRADLHWMDMALGEALNTYDMDGPHLARVLLDFAYQLASLLEECIPEDTDPADFNPCNALLEVATLQVQTSIMAALATREMRGKDPIWTLPIPPVKAPDEDEHPG